MMVHSRPQVAPLNIDKGRSSSMRGQGSRYYNKLRQQQHSNITPPSTPGTDDHHYHHGYPSMESPSRRIFHNYLRAFYPFHPSCDVSPSTVTLPLEQGDIILVHSVHTNGWADGTLLDTAARGWLPTNYCEAYDHPTMRPLLYALMDFWDTIRGGYSDASLQVHNRDFVRGLIAGVRFLLVGRNREP